MGHMSSDITTRLRRWTHAADAVPASDLMDEAADEIERLRLTPVCHVLSQKNLTLSDAEREAVEGAIASEHQRGAWQWAAVLRGLLERTM